MVSKTIGILITSNPGQMSRRKSHERVHDKLIRQGNGKKAMDLVELDSMSEVHLLGNPLRPDGTVAETSPIEVDGQSDDMMYQAKVCL